MQDWMLSRITDYWDQQVEAIERLSRGLEDVPDNEISAQMEQISAAVKRHADALSDEHLRFAALSMVDDLYKSCAQTSMIDSALLNYLQASGRAFLKALTARGYMLHYFIDNTWERLDGPVIGFPMLFQAAGFAYLCPQEIAAREIEKDKPAEQWPALIANYISDGRAIADELAERCHKEAKHLVYLDIDVTEFPAALKHIGEPGVIHIIRSEAPVAGSRCVVKMPPGPRQAPAAAPSSPRRSSFTIRDADGREVPAGIEDLESMLLPELQSSDSETRRFNLGILKDQVTQYLSATTPDTDTTAVKALLVKFQNAGWQLARSNVPEGFNAVAASIEAVLDAVAVNQSAKAVLPTVLGPQLIAMAESPAAQGPNLIPPFAALLQAIKRAQDALH